MNLMTSDPTLKTAVSSLWAWFKVHPKTRNILLFLGICTVFYFFNSGVAWADNESDPRSQTLFLPLDGMTDTSGVPVWRYLNLPMDPGNGTYFMRSVRYTIASILWGLYTAPLVGLLALVDWIVSFEWLVWIAAPFETIADGVSSVLEAWMLIPIGISISAAWIAIGFLRGRMGAATVEFIMVALVLALVSSPLTQPFEILAGDGTSAESSQGLIRKAGDIGAEAGAVTVNQEADVEDATLTGSIIDVTLRRPMLMMSFGSPLEDNEECAKSWNTNAAEDSDKDAEDIRKEVIKCDDDVADANQTSSYMWFGSYILAWPTTAGVALILTVFVVFLTYQVFQALYSSLMTVVRGFIAAYPGNSRTAWLGSLFQVLVSAVMVGVYIFALTIYIWLMGKIIDNLPPAAVQNGLLLMGILIIVAAISFWKMKRSGDSIAKRVSRALGRTGLSKNAQDQKPSKLGSVAGKATTLYHRSKMLRAARTGATTAAAVGTGGATAAAAKAGGAVGTSMAGKAGKAMANKALPPSPTQPQLSGAPKENHALPPASPPAEAGSPTNPPLQPAGDGSANAMPLPVGQGQDAKQSVPEPTHGSPDNQPEAPVQPTAHRTSPEPQPTSPAQKPRVSNTSHIPAGRYGNTWVHKGGQIHSPETIRPDGTPVKNVPHEDKMHRAFQQGDSWVTSPDVQNLNPAPTPMRSASPRQTPGPRSES